MQHENSTIDEYRRCEARFMNMFPSIPCSASNLLGLFGILQDHTRITTEFQKLDYAGRHRALKNLENAIKYRKLAKNQEDGHVAFWENEELLFAALDGLPKLPEPARLQLASFEDVDNIDYKKIEM